MQTEMIKEAQYLYGLGLGVHALKPNSKQPMRSKWSGPTRDPIEQIIKDLESVMGAGLGVRLGLPSTFGDGTVLACIDIDLKGGEKYEAEAFALVDKHFPGVREKAPMVKTGRGFHIYIRVPKACKSGKLGSSADKVTVTVGGEEVQRNAWEVEVMCVGKQVVLPPTLHPDTGKPYRWMYGFNIRPIPLVQWPVAGVVELDRDQGKDSVLQGFEPVAVDLDNSPLDNKYVKMIVEGEGVTDRSAAMLSAGIALLNAKFTKEQFLSVFTDRANFLGRVVYEHTGTSSYVKNLAWVEKYCWLPAMKAVSPEYVFKEETGSELLSEDAAKVQEIEIAASVDWQSKLTKTGKKGEGPPAKTIGNVVLVLENALDPAVIRRDTFCVRDFYSQNVPWQKKANEQVGNADADLIRHWLGENYRFEPTKDVARAAISVLASKNQFDSVRDWLEDLPAWDGKERLNTWLAEHFEAKGNAEYLAQVFRKWMYAMVMRVYRPGAKFDWMIIFEGAQGIGKSSFGRLLCGDKYFVDWLPKLSDKDAAIALHGSWVIEMGELASLRVNEINDVKAFLSRTTDKLRPPYGDRMEDFARRCIFFGTTNKGAYLKDNSGNRRFKPVEVGRLDFKALERDRFQLFAEAKFLHDIAFENEENLDTEGEARDYELKIQGIKTVYGVADAMHDALHEFILKEQTKSEAERFDFSRFKMQQLWQGDPFGPWRFDNIHMQYAADVFRKFGGHKISFRGVAYWRIEVETI